MARGELQPREKQTLKSPLYGISPLDVGKISPRKVHYRVDSKRDKKKNKKKEKKRIKKRKRKHGRKRSLSIFAAPCKRSSTSLFDKSVLFAVFVLFVDATGDPTLCSLI